MAVDAVPLAPPPRRKGAGLFLTDGRQSVAAGNGLSGGVAGVTAVISVRCRDARNEPQTKGGDVVLVSITPEGGPTTDAHVVDNTDGTYTCTYVPTVASANCRVKVTVNGTHVVGSPFPAQVAPGRTHALASEVFGHGLNDGVAGQSNHFTIQTKDPFGNRCVASEGSPDDFVVTVKPLSALLAEYDSFLRKYEVQPVLTDNGDGTHAVEYTVDYAGFYAVDVTLNNVPVGDSPYVACIYNPTIAFPEAVTFEALPGESEALPAGARACDAVPVHDVFVVLKSLPIEMTGHRREREFLHYYKLRSALGGKGKDEWKSLTLRGAMLPPPYRRFCCCIDQKLLVLAHTDKGAAAAGPSGLTPLDHVRVLDLSELKEGEVQWGAFAMSAGGAYPPAVDGYSLSVWGGRGAVLLFGGVDSDGGLLGDIWLLTLGAAMADGAAASWRMLRDSMSSIFSNDLNFQPRANASLTCRDGTPTFWIFGGRGDDDELLNDLCTRCCVLLP